MTCTANPVLADAAPLAFDPQKPKDTIAVLDGHARCVNDGHGGRSLYRVFTLPQTTVPYVLLLTAPPWGNICWRHGRNF